MTLEPAGRAAVAHALRGYIGLLVGDTELNLPRQLATLDRPATVTFEPVRSRTRVTGITLFQNNVRVLTQPLPQPVDLAAGQKLTLTVRLGD